MKDTMIGVDLAKNVFQLHGASLPGELTFRKKFSRAGFICFMHEQDPAVSAIEACGGANYWALELARMGHEVTWVASQYVCPFIKRQKMMQRMLKRLSSPRSGQRCVMSSPGLKGNEQDQLCSVPGSACCIGERSW